MTATAQDTTFRQVSRDSRVAVSVGFEHTTGRYGEDTPTRTEYAPVSLRYRGDRWYGRLTIPWLSIDGPALATPDSGVAPAPGRTSRANGLGDVLIRYGYTVIDEGKDRRPGFDIAARVRLPTASRSRGLGAGTWDYSLQGDLYDTFGLFRPYVTAGYRVIERPAGDVGHNVWFGSVGTYLDISDRSALGVFYDVRERSSRFALPIRELTVQIDYRLTPRTKLELYVLKGFATGSPERGIGFSFIYYL
jgi:hypothetical protein